MDFSGVDPRAHGESVCRGVLRASNEDFVVEEVLGFTPEGEGEHAYIQLTKSGANTEWVAKLLAGFYGVAPSAVSFSGLKDRHALTTQWFCVHQPGIAPVAVPQIEDCEVHQVVRGLRKLRRGVHKQNRFVLCLRDIEGERAEIEKRLDAIATTGFPNYFGPQRFGREQGNLGAAERWFGGQFRPKSRNKKSLYLSAARAWLFNRQLAERIGQGQWLDLAVGERAGLEGSSAHFEVNPDDAALAERLSSGDIHPLGVLWGKRKDGVPEADPVLAPWQALCDGLIAQGLKQEYRPLRALAHDLSYEWLADGALRLSFTLNRGSYATGLLAELGEFTEAPRALPTPPNQAEQ